MYNDCFDYGLLPVTLDEEGVEAIASRITSNPEVGMTVDLARQVIEGPGMEPISFILDPRLRNRLLLGSDDLDERLQHS